MRINYKKELENAAKTMILVHEPEILIKLIVRTIVQKVHVSHAGILLHMKERDTYLLTVSRGGVGVKIPAGYARMDADNPLIRLFKERSHGEGAFILDDAKRALRRKLGTEQKKLLKAALYQMDIFQVEVCVPSYFRDELLALLLLGRKNNGKKFIDEEIGFFVALASDVAMAIRNAQLFKDLELEARNKYNLFINTIEALATAIDAKDHYTHGHTERVTNLSLAIAKKMSVMHKHAYTDAFFEHLRIASLLHDIGKIGIPEGILNKNGPLNDDERRKMKEHPAVGASILEPIQELKDVILGVKYHHERFDGTGYPEGLRGDQIPLIAAVISVADAFDAMTTDRPYRPGLTKEAAIDEVIRGKNVQFEPVVADALVALYHEKRV